MKITAERARTTAGSAVGFKVSQRAVRQQIMTVAPWEFWSLATILIGTHGDQAEEEAAERLRVAEAEDDTGQKVVWTEVIRKLKDIRAENA
ncbi:hypothetical protein [Sphingomonas sp. PWP1-2]|uniref:hypothetical protein n=1 Tax=Sphingomonas sp. PWP1-2 TaxID=2804558 RepID=UPI003CF2B47F